MLCERSSACLCAETEVSPVHAYVQTARHQGTEARANKTDGWLSWRRVCEASNLKHGLKGPGGELSLTIFCSCLS